MVQLFRTCLVNDFFPEAGIAAVELLERAGFEVDVPRGQTCCGQPAWNAGFRAEARAVAGRTIEQLARTEGPIVIPSGSCADMLVHQTAELFRDDAAMAAKASLVAARCSELTQFLADPAQRDGAKSPPERSTQTPSPRTASSLSTPRVAYHPSCHLARGLGVKSQPRELLAAAGVELASLMDEEECCGFGGMFSVKQPEISGALLDRKCAAIEKSGAEVVTSCDAGCLLHLLGGLRRRGSKVEVRHVAELLHRSGA